MALFSTDSLVLEYADLEAGKRWWIGVFACKPVRVPADWDCSLPSDVALTLPGDQRPTILLRDRAKREQAGFAAPDECPILFCSRIEKAHEALRGHGPIQELGGARFFEIRDPEGHAIEISTEP
jgi:catechol 2,3-dioxygenase-like lactoylglutathione lyase family enzyme